MAGRPRSQWLLRRDQNKTILDGQSQTDWQRDSASQYYCTRSVT